MRYYTVAACLRKANYYWELRSWAQLDKDYVDAGNCLVQARLWEQRAREGGGVYWS